MADTVTAAPAANAEHGYTPRFVPGGLSGALVVNMLDDSLYRTFPPRPRMFDRDQAGVERVEGRRVGLRPRREPSMTAGVIKGQLERFAGVPGEFVGHAFLASLASVRRFLKIADAKTSFFRYSFALADAFENSRSGSV
jgi:hypothetical protein